MRLIVGLEGLEDGIRVARPGPQPRLAVNADEFDTGGHTERHRGFAGKRHLHEVAEDGRGDAAARLALAHGLGRVEPDKDAGHEIGRETDEPGVLFVICGAGLAGERLANGLDAPPGAPLDHAFKHRCDLIGGVGIDDLLAQILDLGLVLAFPFGLVAIDAAADFVPPDGAPPTVLNAIDKGGAHLFAAVGEHRVGSGQAQQRGLASAQ